MDDYYVNREDWDNIMELGYQSLVQKIPSKTKSAFTRLYSIFDVGITREAIQVHFQLKLPKGKRLAAVKPLLKRLIVMIF
jgi:hypothetical protein